MKKIIVYSTPYCGYCKRAKDLLSKLKLDFSEVDLAENDKLREELSEKYSWQTVPMIVIDGKFIGGFDDLNKLYQAGGLEELIGDSVK